MSEIQIQDQLPGNGAAAYEDDEISLIDLIAVLWRYKWLVIIATCAAAFISLLVAFISIKMPAEKSFWPNSYTATAIIKANDSSSSSSSSSSNGSLLNFISTSDTLYDAIAQGLNFEEKYNVTGEKKKSTMRSMVKNSMKVETDKSTKMVKISYTCTDANFAYRVVDFAVEWMNSYLEENYKKLTARNIDDLDILIVQTAGRMDEISNEMRNLAESSQEYSRLDLELKAQQQAFMSSQNRKETLTLYLNNVPEQMEVFQAPEVPERKSAPSRGKTCMIVTLAAFFVSVFAAFAINAIQNIRKDPVAMAKFRN